MLGMCSLEGEIIKMIKQLVLAFALLFMIVPRIWADEMSDLIPIDPDDPEVIHMGSGVNTTCASGDASGCQIYNGHLNALNNNAISIYMNGAGQSTQQNPILLILGIPNVSDLFSAPTITGVSFYNNYPQTG